MLLAGLLYVSVELPLFTAAVPWSVWVVGSDGCSAVAEVVEQRPVSKVPQAGKKI